MWRNPPTAILLMATAIVSSWRSTTGSWVISAPIRWSSGFVPATLSTASRSVKIPTSRPPSTTSTQSMPLSCIRRIASSTSVAASTISGAATPSASRCSPNSWPRNEVAGSGTSRPARSEPQLSQTSDPSRFSKPQVGQRISVPLLDGPGLAAREGRGKIALAGRRDCGDDLLLDQLVVRRPRDRPQDADGYREIGPEHPREHECEVWLLRGLVVDEEIRLADAVLADRHDFRMETPQPDPLVTVLAEDHRLAVLQHEHPVLADLAVREVPPRAVVEDVAVLEDLDERRAVVQPRPLERLLEVLRVGIDAAGDERGLGGERDGQRLDRRVDGAGGRRLRLLPELARRRG